MRTTPARPGGMAMRMMNGSTKERELGHQHEIDERDGENQPKPEVVECLVHADVRASHGQAHVVAGWRIGQQR